MSFDQKTIDALAYLRLKASSDDSQMSKMINTLDDAGVFAALDEQTDYASAMDVLAESAAMHLSGRLVTLDPAFYGTGKVMAVAPRDGGEDIGLDSYNFENGTLGGSEH